MRRARLAGPVTVAAFLMMAMAGAAAPAVAAPAETAVAVKVVPLCPTGTPLAEIRRHGRCAPSLADARAYQANERARTSAAPRRDAAAAGITAPPRPPTFPNQCQQLSTGAPRWAFARFQGCVLSANGVVLFRVPGGQVLGTATVEIHEWTELDRANRTWKQHLRIENVFATDQLVTGLYVKSADHPCDLADPCSRLSVPLPSEVNIPYAAGAGRCSAATPTRPQAPTCGST
jgi:hypothetical protein